MAKETCYKMFQCYEVYQNGTLIFTGTASEVADRLGISKNTISRYTKCGHRWHIEYTFRYNGKVERECRTSGGGKKKSETLMPFGTGMVRHSRMMSDGSKWKQYIGMYQVGDDTPWGKVVEVTDRFFRVVRGGISECYAWVDLMVGVSE